jgi:hypothetical protein
LQLNPSVVRTREPMLKWATDYAPLPERVLAGAELILGIALPSSYRELVQAYPGGAPETGEKAEDRPGGWLSSVGLLMSVDPRHPENVFAALEHLAVDDQLPPGLIPIIADGGGDLICLDFRSQAGEPSVVYWAHELSGKEAVVAVAQTFAGFLGVLEAESAEGNHG